MTSPIISRKHELKASQHPKENPTGSRIFIRNLVLDAKIGVHRHEQRRKQPVRINVEVLLDDLPPPKDDTLEEVLDYETIVEGIRTIVRSDHINLVESLAEKIADICLSDPMAKSAKIRVEKLQIIAEAESVGVEIERTAT